MKKLFSPRCALGAAGLVLIFAFAPALQAQSAQGGPASGGQPAFTVSTQAIAFRGAGASDIGTDAIGVLAISKNFALRTDNFLVPAEGLTYNTGGFQYQRSLADFFKSSASKPTASRWQLYANAGIGAITAPTPPHFAANFGGGLNYDLTGSGTFGLNVVQVEGLVGRFTLTNGRTGQVALGISTGVKFSF